MKWLLPVLALVAPQVGFAHNLLPEQLRLFVANNPGATAAEIQAYAANIDSETATMLTSVAEQTTLEFIYNFTELGVEHILIGTDHILFLVALILTVFTWRMVLKRTIVFTVAHSLTFILAGTTALTLSSQIVEPVIAFSIAAMALLSLRPQELRYETIIIFVLGLFHGLGFAGLLADLQLPSEAFIAALILFNVGIELGQLLIVLLVFPFFKSLRQWPWWPSIQLTLVSALVVIGVGWGIERILFG